MKNTTLFAIAGISIIAYVVIFLAMDTRDQKEKCMAKGYNICASRVATGERF